MSKLYENTTYCEPGTDEWYQKAKVTHSDEYKEYLEALCHLACRYVPRIRVQYAIKAYEKYQDPTLRRLVLAYGKEFQKLEDDRLRAFTRIDDRRCYNDSSFEDSVLNNAKHYAEAIHALFDIDFSGREE